MESVDLITDVQASDDVREITKDELIAQLNQQLQSMTEQADNKLKHAYDQLLTDLTIYQEKWKTASGFIYALKTLREITDYQDYTVEEKTVKVICRCMIDMVEAVLKQIKSYDVPDDFYDEAKDLFMICNVYNPKFVYTKEICSPDGVALEELCLQFCQQFGPALEDAVDFRNGAREQMAKVQDRINELNFSTEE